MATKQKKKSLDRKTAMYSRVRRRNEFLMWALRELDARCEHCGKAVDIEEFFGWRDSVTLHHVNEDRSKNLRDDIRDDKELVIMHRGCHRKHHQGTK